MRLSDCRPAADRAQGAQEPMFSCVNCETASCAENFPPSRALGKYCRTWQLYQKFSSTLELRSNFACWVGRPLAALLLGFLHALRLARCLLARSMQHQRGCSHEEATGPSSFMLRGGVCGPRCMSEENVHIRLVILYIHCRYIHSVDLHAYRPALGKLVLACEW